jgi:hypothetical protein
MNSFIKLIPLVFCVIMFLAVVTHGQSTQHPLYQENGREELEELISLLEKQSHDEAMLQKQKLTAKSNENIPTLPKTREGWEELLRAASAGTGESDLPLRKEKPSVQPSSEALNAEMEDNSMNDRIAELKMKIRNLTIPDETVWEGYGINRTAHAKETEVPENNLWEGHKKNQMSGAQKKQKHKLLQEKLNDDMQNPATSNKWKDTEDYANLHFRARNVSALPIISKNAADGNMKILNRRPFFPNDDNSNYEDNAKNPSVPHHPTPMKDIPHVFYNLTVDDSQPMNRGHHQVKKPKTHTNLNHHASNPEVKHKTKHISPEEPSEPLVSKHSTPNDYGNETSLLRNPDLTDEVRNSILDMEARIQVNAVCADLNNQIATDENTLILCKGLFNVLDRVSNDLRVARCQTFLADVRNQSLIPQICQILNENIRFIRDIDLFDLVPFNAPADNSPKSK